MIQQVPMEALHRRFDVPDFIPQAVFAIPMAHFASSGIQFHEDSDDFDQFIGAAIVVDDDQPLMIKHYRGHPPGTVTLYLPSDVVGVDRITARVRELMAVFHLPEESLSWERRLDPEL